MINVIGVIMFVAGLAFYVIGYVQLRSVPPTKELPRGGFPSPPGPRA